jgi:hypothetical protein
VCRSDKHDALRYASEECRRYISSTGYGNNSL